MFRSNWIEAKTTNEIQERPKSHPTNSKEASHMEQERSEQHEEKQQVEQTEQVGRKGGATAAAIQIPFESEATAVAYRAGDLVRWGPVWAGLLLALSIQLVLGSIGLAVVLTVFDPTAANFIPRAATTLSIWAAVSGLIALFIGGYVAGRMAAVLGFRNGLVQGSLVWALAVVAGMILGAAGVGGLLSMASISNLMQSLQLGGEVARRAATMAAGSAWWFVVGAVVAWAAAASGGVLGSAAHREAIEESKQ
jgi:hypothetical protein